MDSIFSAPSVKLPASVDDFLMVHPDPVATFGDKHHRTEHYQKVVRVFLLNEFPFMKGNIITEVLRKNNYLVQQALHILSALNLRADKPELFRDEIRPVQGKPSCNVQAFVDEVYYTMHFSKIMAKVEERRNREEEATEFQKADCIGCGAEVLKEDMSACTGDHSFCAGCIRKAAQGAADAGSSNVQCCYEWCPHTFYDEVLDRVVPQRTLARIGVVKCPFCGTDTKVPASQSVLQCTGCRKASCRKCRTPISEEEMGEMAIMRWTECWKCMAE